MSRRQWEIFWEIPECPPFLTSEPARFFTKYMKLFCGANFKDCILEYKNNNNIWYLDANEWSVLDQVLFQKIKKSKVWGNKINQIAKDSCSRCLKFLDNFTISDLSTLTDYQLFQRYSSFMKIYIPAHGSGHPANVLEMKNQRLSNYLKTYLQKKIYSYDADISANESFAILVTPTKDMSPQLEAKSFYKTGSLIVRSTKLKKIFKKRNLQQLLIVLKNDYPKIWKTVKRHARDWCWTSYNYEGPANNIEYYLDSWASMIRQNKSFANAYNQLEKETINLKKKQKKLQKTLRIDTTHRRLLKVASDIMFYKALRKDCIYKGAYTIAPLYEEISQRLGLTAHQVKFIFHFEMKEAIVNRNYDKKLIRQRAKEVILHQRAGKDDIIRHGKNANNFIKSLCVQKPDSATKELQGQCAYPGKIRGKIKLVNTPDMMNKMKKGDILVAYATQPNLLPAMKKASAFITDFGGITCHAAIVAREWKVPCVIGTGNASKILNDGELVEVDAEQGIVRRIKIANNL